MWVEESFVKLCSLFGVQAKPNVQSMIMRSVCLTCWLTEGSQAVPLTVALPVPCTPNRTPTPVATLAPTFTCIVVCVLLAALIKINVTCNNFLHVSCNFHAAFLFYFPAFNVCFFPCSPTWRVTFSGQQKRRLGFPILRLPGLHCVWLSSQCCCLSLSIVPSISVSVSFIVERVYKILIIARVMVMKVHTLTHPHTRTLTYNNIMHTFRVNNMDIKEPKNVLQSRQQTSSGSQRIISIMMSSFQSDTEVKRTGDHLS